MIAEVSDQSRGTRPSDAIQHCRGVGDGDLGDGRRGDNGEVIEL